MIDQNTFLETLRGVSEIVRTAGRPMSEEEILQYFAEMELTEEQKAMVVSYMQLPEEVRNPGPEEEDSAKETEEDEEEEEAEAETAEEPEEITLEKLSDSAFYRMYLEEVRAKKVQSRTEQMALYEKLVAGDTSVTETIVNNWLLRVMEMAKLYRGLSVNMEDLIQEGNMGLWLALSQKPEVHSAAEVDDYLAAKVKAAMEQYISETTGESDWMQALLGKAALLLEARNVLKEEKGAEPSLRQISEYTHIPAEEVQDILALYKENEEKGK